MSELLPRIPFRGRVLALCFVAVALVQLSTVSGVPLQVGHELVHAALVAALWTGAVALAVALTRRYPVELGSGGMNLPIHLGAAALVGLAHHLGNSLLTDWHSPTGSAWASDFIAAVVAYLLIAGVAHAMIFRRRLREKELAELRLQAELSEAELERARYELQALKMELNPHFLFNSLHAISALMHQDAKLANRMLVRVSDLLRHALASVGTQRVALEEELDFARLFLEVEEVRFGGRLRVDWEVEEDACALSVPHMILQPLVENAVKHGIAPRGSGRIVVGARRDGETLRLEVRDDGVGLAPPGAVTDGSGVGLKNVRERLRQLAGSDHSFELRPTPGGGVAALVGLPWEEVDRRAPAGVDRGAAAFAESGLYMKRAASDDAARRRGRTLALALFLGLWGLGLVSLMETLPEAGRAAAPWRAVFSAGLNAAMLTVLAAAAFERARRFPIRRDGWRAHLPVHLATAATLAVVGVAAKAAGRLLMRFPADEILPQSIPSMLGGYGALYAVLAAVAHALMFARGYRQKEAAELLLRRELSRAEVERTRAELQILKIELNPHFLFSALHAISALIPRDLKLANRILVRLSEVLRGALRNRGARDIPLEEEVSGLEPVLEIEGIRWGGRLRVEWHVEDEALDARVPPMLLQSLVEHLLQHGVDGGSEHRRLSISARRAGPHLELRLRDHGLATLAEPAAPGSGSGLDAIRTRLRQTFGEAQRLRVEESAIDGVLLAVTLPWREEESREEPQPATTGGATPLLHAQPR